MKIVLIPFVALAALTVLAEKQPFERYQSIVDRQMFGPLPEGFDPTKSPNEVQKSSSKDEKQLTQEQEKLQSSVHFSVINVTPEGATAVGFTDNSDPKAPKHYFLKVGESRDGWAVKEADAEKATMTIAKGDIEVSLTLGGNSAKDGGTSRAGGASSAAPTAGGARHPGLLGGGGLMGGSQRARRLQRQQEAAAAAAKQREEQAAKDAERQAQAEQEKQQREQERAEQRQQLLAIQEELKRVREAKAAAKQDENGDAENNAE